VNRRISASIIRRAGVFTAAAIVAVAPLAIAPAGASVSACAAWTGTQPPNPAGLLHGVAVLSPCNAWAVGSYNTSTASQTLIVHWNGSSWKQVASPNPGGPSTDNILTGVAATSATNAWAVGYYFTETDGERTLIEHWNGTVWRQVRSPNPPSGSPSLSGVAATSARNAWAVGSYNGGHGADLTLIARWNGTAWRQVRSPSPGRVDNLLTGVAASSSRSAWAVGGYFTGTAWRTLIVRWNGTAWRHVRSPHPGHPDHVQNLLGVSALSARNAWAVGYYDKGIKSKTLIEHWNGTAWRRVHSPTPPADAELSAVAPTSPRNAWAVGSSNTEGPAHRTLIEHWNGTAWRRVRSPNPGTANVLLGVAATSATNIWAVGWYSGGPLALHCC
jgi:hypothetical protein